MAIHLISFLFKTGVKGKIKPSLPWIANIVKYAMLSSFHLNDYLC